jgi:hypothetical protein
VTLREALLALFPAGVHEGEAPQGATLPWTVATLDVPTPNNRSLAGRAHSQQVRVRATVGAANAHACSIVAERVRTALEFARPVADGWTCGPLMHVSSRPIARDPQVIVPTTNTSAFYAVLDFELTASQVA